MWYKIYNLNIHETMEEAQYKKIGKEITKQIKILQKIIPSYSTTKALKTLLDDPKNLNFISKYEEFKKEYKNKKNIEKRVYIDYCSEMLTKGTEEHKIYLSKISEKRKEYGNEYIKLIANRSDIEKHYIFMFDQIPNSLKSVILCFDENGGEQKLVDILKVHNLRFPSIPKYTGAIAGILRSSSVLKTIINIGEVDKKASKYKIKLDFLSFIKFINKLVEKGKIEINIDPNTKQYVNMNKNYPYNPKNKKNITSEDDLVLNKTSRIFHNNKILLANKLMNGPIKKIFEYIKKEKICLHKDDIIKENLSNYRKFEVESIINAGCNHVFSDKTSIYYKKFGITTKEGQQCREELMTIDKDNDTLKKLIKKCIQDNFENYYILKGFEMGSM